MYGKLLLYVAAAGYMRVRFVVVSRLAESATRGYSAFSGLGLFRLVVGPWVAVVVFSITTYNLHQL